MITNSGAEWLREMARIEAEGNREFDLLSHVFRALDPPPAATARKSALSGAQEGFSIDVRTADVGIFWDDAQ